ncbi:MAG: hypothetical protein ABIR59_09325 [Gemmatimonadales bacterium]
MNPYLPAAKQLAVIGLALVVVLVLTDEFYWGSGAMILFAGVWTAGALDKLLKIRRASKAKEVG